MKKLKSNSFKIPVGFDQFKSEAVNIKFIETALNNFTVTWGWNQRLEIVQRSKEVQGGYQNIIPAQQGETVNPAPNPRERIGAGFPLQIVLPPSEAPLFRLEKNENINCR